MLTRINPILQTTKLVMVEPQYIGISAAIAIMMYSATVATRNLSLLAYTLTTAGVTDFGRLLFNLLTAVEANFTPLTLTLSVFVSLLAGMNVAFYVYGRKTTTNAAQKAEGIGGFLAGMLGVGCASCGSVALAALGFSGAVALLPLGGAEFSLVAIALLLLSLHALSKSIAGCKPKGF